MRLPDVRPGQVWADNDPRCEGRTVRVERITVLRDTHVAICTVLTKATRATMDRTVGRQTVIAVRRFRPNSTGYRLITEV